MAPRLDAIPLSLSMPPLRAVHPHAAIDPFLWGLLPDNEQTLARWAARFHVSARNALGLLAHIGEDCAGAVQFVPAERLQALQSPAADDISWLDEVEIGERLRALRRDPSATRRATEDRAAAARWSLGRSRRAHAHHAYPEADHRRIRRPRRE